MGIKLNSAGYERARQLIADGKVDRDSAWDFSAEDGNKMLDAGKGEMAFFAVWHLGHREGADENTKECWAYPFGKDGQVYRSALTAIRQRAGQQNDTAVFEAAGKLLEELAPAETKERVLLDQDLTTAPKRVLIFKRGETEFKNASHGGSGKFLIDDAAIRLIMDDFKARGVDMVLDYEHQTHQTDQGITAPAAGWIKQLVADATGLWGEVEWTQKAAAYIAEKAYRYISPTFIIRKPDTRVTRLISVALTNIPATVNAHPLTVLRYDPATTDPEKEGKDMALLQELAKLHGLPETASEEEVMAAVKKAKEKEPQRVEVYPVALKRELGLPDDAPDDKVKLTLDTRLKLPQGVVPGERVEALERELDEQKFDRAFDTLVMNQLAMPSECAEAKVMWDAGAQVWETHVKTLTAGQRFVGLNKRLRGSNAAADQATQLNQALDEYMEKHPEEDAVEAAKKVFGGAKLSKAADTYVEAIRLRQPVREPGSSRAPRV